MSGWKMPGFTAESSLQNSGRDHRSSVASRTSSSDPATAYRSLVVPAQSVPGGPSTVPSGYSRECKRVPYRVCDANGCRTEYGWVCVYYPLPRARTHFFNFTGERTVSVSTGVFA